MENLETHQTARALGRHLIELLENEHESSIVSRWIAYHIAELMKACETSSEGNVLSDRDRCFQTILKLWHHRYSFPDGLRPFERFEKIMEIIERIDPLNPRNLYLRFDKIEENCSENLKELLIGVQVIDRVSRIIIESYLKTAGSLASNEELRKLLDEHLRNSNDPDINAIEWLLDLRNMDSSKETSSEDESSRMQLYMDSLDMFITLAAEFRSKLGKRQIKRLSRKRSPKKM